MGIVPFLIAIETESFFATSGYFIGDSHLNWILDGVGRSGGEGRYGGLEGEVNVVWAEGEVVLPLK